MEKGLGSLGKKKHGKCGESVGMSVANADVQERAGAARTSTEMKHLCPQQEPEKAEKFK